MLSQGELGWEHLGGCGVGAPHGRVLSWRVWGNEGLVFRDAMFPDVPQEYRWGAGLDECLVH